MSQLIYFCPKNIKIEEKNSHLKKFIFHLFTVDATNLEICAPGATDLT